MVELYLSSPFWRLTLLDSTPHEWPELGLRYGLLDEARLAVKALVRSAVFSTLDFAGGAGRPEIDEPLELAAIKPYCITQVGGVRLSQTDADLFFWLLSRAYRFGSPKKGAWVYFKCGEALAELGRSRGGKTDTLLEESLHRLYSFEFTYEIRDTVGRLRLLSTIERFESGTKPYDYKVMVSDAVAPLLADDEWLVIPGKVKKQLSRDSLAKGLYAFYASHKTVYPMLPSTLKSLMGRESMQESKWRHALDAALAKVQATTGWFQLELVKTGPKAGKIVFIKGASSGRRPVKQASGVDQPPN